MSPKIRTILLALTAVLSVGSAVDVFFIINEVQRSNVLLDVIKTETNDMVTSFDGQKQKMEKNLSRLDDFLARSDVIHQDLDTSHIEFEQIESQLKAAIQQIHTSNEQLNELIQAPGP